MKPVLSALLVLVLTAASGLTMGLHAVSLRSGVGFVATVVGIAVLDGSVSQWSRAQQRVDLIVMAGRTWLIMTAREAR